MTEPTKQTPKWYHSNWSLAVLFITVGPLAIPVVWTNPNYDKGTKWLITSCMLVLTVLMSWVFWYFVRNILDYYKLLAETSV
jgi:hypothetical protein